MQILGGAGIECRLAQVVQCLKLVKLLPNFQNRKPLRLAFTKNATEALNIAIKGVLRKGDHVITTSMEHNAVIRPLKEMEKRKL